MKNSFRQNSGRGKLLAATMLALLVIGGDALSGGAVRVAVRDLAASVFERTRPIATLEVGELFATRRALLQENATLRDTLRRLEDGENARRAALAENEALRAIARIAEDEDRHGIGAPVLASHAASPYGTFIIGAGRAQGVAVGSIVLTGGGFLLGAVTDAGERASTVRSLFAPGNTVSVVIGDAQILAEGRGGGNARAEAPRDANIEVGDVAHVPSFGGRPVALVGAVEVEPASASATVFLRTPSNIDTLHYVYVLPPVH
ncbi:hypothetical protein COU20_00185 [Candidatus Kaiserbacteria bacterium CG10_big_fil_rev_8_21_14_0_10_59_10]|uniref:Cell shape-determining protein MreC n=1 Tax=Candidatus Kaiserbacteria bacterium CG10_big_fil_rev_8_21_14_0_10_59_10 TaxID=1974612 RepID=A0A2H0U8U9_9BACT|nr:MAG: hypothetical protein COU20_00185 [Candidatus Kaiserbacteria bacterium CG10_big_fil_rev_8_21_14_0_10_59_10]